MNQVQKRHVVDHVLKPRKEKTMKSPKTPHLFSLSLALVAAILTLASVRPATAAPTVRPFGGVTSVQLSMDFIDALGSLNLTPAALAPGTLSEGVARFPIAGAGLDQATLKGDVFHVGGLSLTNEGGTIVQLFNFIIDTTGEQAVLTGLVAIDDDLVARVPLFNLDLTNAQVKPSPFSLAIRNVAMSLTADAATALNNAFGVNAFAEGFNIGTADVTALF
jgi:hypothetical protein